MGLATENEGKILCCDKVRFGFCTVGVGVELVDPLLGDMVKLDGTV